MFEKISCPSVSLGASLSAEQLSLGLEAGQRSYVRVRANEAVQQVRDQSWCPVSKSAKGPAALQDAILSKFGLCPLDSVLSGLEWVNTDTEWNKCFQ